MADVQYVPSEGDTTDATVRHEVFETMRHDHGAVNICVPAAGVTRDDLAVRVNKEQGKAQIYPIESFREVVEVNLIAPVYWALEMVAQLAEERFERGLKKWDASEGTQGAIVFIGSVSSQGNKGQIAYATTKVGLEGAASTLMKEAMFYGVRCAVIHPGSPIHRWYARSVTNTSKRKCCQPPRSNASSAPKRSPTQSVF